MSRKQFQFHARDKVVFLGPRTRILGIVNVTPDSFHEGGRFSRLEDAVDQCLRLIADGADAIDVGGESTRPGARPVEVQEEIRRVVPVIEAIRDRVAVPISVDTRKAAVAAAALRAGADIVNDVSSLADPDMAETIGAAEAGVVLCHMRGVPADMQLIPPSPDILAEIRQAFRGALQTADSHGIQRDRIILDPGIGFGKTVEDNLRIINRLDFLDEFRLPVLVGTSRKSFLGKILNADEKDRLWGTAASISVAILRGAHWVRVHDVREIGMVAAVSDALMAESLRT